MSRRYLFGLMLLALAGCSSPPGQPHLTFNNLESPLKESFGSDEMEHTSDHVLQFQSQGFSEQQRGMLWGQ
ncbi:MAG: hypothetical protein GAK43_02270 [Stenotrophomonas maltophilia]|nr:MAG: hypothetical protein GAK43_02270 [Stenotrophomonas maltophilia]